VLASSAATVVLPEPETPITTTTTGRGTATTLSPGPKWCSRHPGGQ
jgi:hypothetical protein